MKDKIQNIILCVALIVTLVSGFVVVCFAAKADAERKNSITYHKISYTVQNGDTLWAISKDYCPDDLSIQEYIYLLKKENNLGSVIYPGQIIQVLIEEK